MTDLPVPIPEAQLPAVADTITYPVKELQLVLRACNPGKPLQTGDERRADLTALRHKASIEPLRRELMMQLDPNEFHHGLLCGHRGCGKSTELLTLQQWADQQGFLAVWADANKEYGMVELDYSDLFLLAAVAVEEAMHDFGHRLPPAAIKNIIQWFSEVTKEDTQQTESEIGVEVTAQLNSPLPQIFGGLFAKIAASFKGTTTHARKTRETLRKYPDTLIDKTNALLKTANEILIKNNKPRGLLLVFDNLDRYDPAHIDNILVRSSQQMRRLACHALFTYPISLAYKPISGRVSTEYGKEVVLPMLALRKQEMVYGNTIADSRFDLGNIALLRQALEKRVVIKKLFTNPQDADLLIKMSGGVIRDLIRLVESAATFTEDERQITTEAVQSAINELRNKHMRSLATTPQDYRCLAVISRRSSVVTQPSDFSEQLDRLLFNGSLLEYMEDGEIWRDVHPVLVDTKEFHDACIAHTNS